MDFGPSLLAKKPGVRPQPTNEYGLRDILKSGISPLKDSFEPSHPLQVAEETYSLRQEKLNMMILRDVQGLHAPLKLAAELRASKQVGHLPFLECSKLSYSTILGHDDIIEFSDILNPVDLYEKNMIPHVMME